MKTFAFLALAVGLSAGKAAEDHPYRSFCPGFSCTLPANDPVHSDPYANRHLCENFDPQLNDHSLGYWTLRTRNRRPLPVSALETSDLASLILRSVDQNGVISLEHTRIRLYFSSAEKDATDRLQYRVRGKSIVSGNICDFEGTIRCKAVFETAPGRRDILMQYAFSEDKSQHHAGVFRGVAEFRIMTNATGTVVLDEALADTPGYWNRTFVGSWTQYGETKPLRCVWGDHRLPFTFDFDCGDESLAPCEKYAANGWESYGGAGDDAPWWENK